MALAISSCATVPEPERAPPDADPLAVSMVLTPFGSDEAFDRYLAAWQERGNPWQFLRRQQALQGDSKGRQEDCDPAVDPDCEPKLDEDRIVVTGSRIATSMTNNQVGGVDEGGIVKRIGNRVIVLRDGRLFVLNIGEGEGAEPVLESRVDLYDDPDENTWFDELLVSENRIVVVGYSYQYDAASYSVVDLKPDGSISLAGRFLLQGNDYFDGSSYAARMVDGVLIFELPVAIEDLDDSEDFIPRFFKPNTNSQDVLPVSRPLIEAGEILRPLYDHAHPVVQLVVRCDVDALLGNDPAGACLGVSFVSGEYGHLYVGQTDMYFWDFAEIHPASRPVECPWDNSSLNLPSPVYRINIDTMQISVAAALGFTGDPTWMGEHDGALFGFTRYDPRICENYNEQGSTNTLHQTLVRLDSSDFSEAFAPERAVSGTELPIIEPSWHMEVRFIGDRVIFANKDWPRWYRQAGEPVFGVAGIADLNGQRSTYIVPVPHRISRLEPAGDEFVMAIGPAGHLGELSLGYTAISLTERAERVETQFTNGRVAVESRTHAYNATSYEDGEDIGYFMGLATVAADRDQSRFLWRRQSAGISFLRLADGQLRLLGNADPIEAERNPDYQCEVSCVDWYGVTRAFFLNNRIFALTDSELIEVDLLTNSKVDVLSRTRLDGPPAN